MISVEVEAWPCIPLQKRHSGSALGWGAAKVGARSGRTVSRVRNIVAGGMVYVGDEKAGRTEVYKSI